MKNLRSELLEQKYEMENILQRAEKDISAAPEGRLRISNGNNGPNFYCCWKDDKTSLNGNYLKKSEQQMIASLAQKNYAEKVKRKIDQSMQI